MILVKMRDKENVNYIIFTKTITYHFLFGR